MLARRRLVLIVVLVVGGLAVLPAPAGAVTPVGAVSAFIDFPSVREIVEDVVKFFFGAFLDALVPDWLRDRSVDALKRLVTVPNPTDASVWPTLARLSEGMRWIAIPLLSLAAVGAWTQQWLGEFAGRAASFEQALMRTVRAALLLVAYPAFFDNAVALTNSVTNAMLSLPAAGQGLERTVGIVFAGTLLSGSGLLLTLLGIAAVLLAVGLFMTNVALLVLFGILFVSAPLAIVASVVDETHGLWTAWRYTLMTAALVPVGWCVLFTTAGAFVADMTNWSGGVTGQLGARFVGVAAAMVILWLAVRWPLMLWGAVRTQISAALLSVGTRVPVTAGGVRPPATGPAARATLQRASVRAGSAAVTPLAALRRQPAVPALMPAVAGVSAAATPPVGGVGLRRDSGSASGGRSGVATAVGGARARAHAVGDAVRATLSTGAASGAVADAAVAAALRPAPSAATPKPSIRATGAVAPKAPPSSSRRSPATERAVGSASRDSASSAARPAVPAPRPPAPAPAPAPPADRSSVAPPSPTRPPLPADVPPPNTGMLPAGTPRTASGRPPSASGRRQHIRDTGTGSGQTSRSARRRSAPGFVVQAPQALLPERAVRVAPPTSAHTSAPAARPATPSRRTVPASMPPSSPAWEDGTPGPQRVGPPVVPARRSRKRLER
ncbi:hypothetical protein VSS74_16340 [Conexibacter stalactiti]|uniref:Uncharacterized protein n=1 Tax=Conexibacter stalactiti TaxID=1940611 RepID=A0ABU4HT31_9ACTN|nr:hypothetical protein [Conexibacter stalactiti]MDW5595919.1 hypothetical protein [Conexibacter stalactiti]MEC5036561.1 hypothetical protein [Conexibacter stalactiti]